MVICNLFQGGIKSVVWTDAFQTVIVFIGMATVLAKVNIADFSIQILVLYDFFVLFTIFSISDVIFFPYLHAVRRWILEVQGKFMKLIQSFYISDKSYSN